jgi:hypothetical protein
MRAMQQRQGAAGRLVQRLQGPARQQLSLQRARPGEVQAWLLVERRRREQQPDVRRLRVDVRLRGRQEACSRWPGPMEERRCSPVGVAVGRCDGVVAGRQSAMRPEPGPVLLRARQSRLSELLLPERMPEPQQRQWGAEARLWLRPRPACARGWLSMRLRAWRPWRGRTWACCRPAADSRCCSCRRS